MLPRLRRIFQKGPDVRTVFTSTRRLARIDERTDFDTSPFLQGFIPPLYLTPLTDGRGARRCSRADASRTTSRTRIAQRTGYHPFLLQLIASRLFESRDLSATLDQVAADEMVGELLLRGLPDARRRASGRSWRRSRARARCTRRALAQAVARSEEALEPLLFGLRVMGYLTETDGALRVGNWFFERWLKRVASRARRRAGRVA